MIESVHYRANQLQNQNNRRGAKNAENEKSGAASSE